MAARAACWAATVVRAAVVDWEAPAAQSVPLAAMTVMEAVCLLMGQKTDWSDAKVLLNQSNFLQQLAEYDKDNIPEKKIKVRGSSAQLRAIRRNCAQFSDAIRASLCSRSKST